MTSKAKNMLDEEKLAELREVFQEYDKDNDGNLDFDDFFDSLLQVPY